MPSLFDVANHFDDIEIYDGYTNAYLYKGQFSSFIEASPDGSTAQRRTMSLAPGLVPPARRAIKALDEVWIIGQGNLDGVFGSVIRQSFWTKKVLATFEILTPGQAASGVTGTSAFGHHIYLKDTVNGISDSEYDPFWEIYFAPTEPVSKGGFLKNGNIYYRVRSTHLEVDGLTNAASDELDSGCRVQCSFVRTESYDPITDTYGGIPGPGVPLGDWGDYFFDDVTGMAMKGVYGILLDGYKQYEQKTEADPKLTNGSLSLVIAQADHEPKVGIDVQIGIEQWRVHGYHADQDAWVLHIRKD